MVPCDSFEPGDATDSNTVVRAQEGVIAAIAMEDAFLLRNTCDLPDGGCRVEKRSLPELSAGSQVMLTTNGEFLVGIDRQGGGVWTYKFDDRGHLVYKDATYTDQTLGPAQLVIGMRDSSQLVVRDHEDRLAIYQPKHSRAIRIAPDLGRLVRLAAVGERHVAIREFHTEHSQTVYIVDVDNTPDAAHVVASGDFTSVAFGPGDQTLVLAEGRGTDASVLVFDVKSREIIDRFAGDLISSRTENDHRAIDEVPGMRALSPSGEQIAYRTTSGALAVRMLGSQSSCLVRNTNRLGTGDASSQRAGNHAVAGFSADGIIFAEYSVGAADSFVYTYDPRHQQITPLGSEETGWVLAAVPGRVTNALGEIERLWALAASEGNFASIGEGRVDGKNVGRELTFMPLDDEGIWAIDTRDELPDSERALSVRRVAPPRWANGGLRFEQDPEDQIVTSSDEQEDNDGPMRVPLSGRVCLTTGSPGAWAYRCGDSTNNRDAFTTDSGRQEQTNDPNVAPEFDPPFPEQDDEDETPS